VDESNRFVGLIPPHSLLAVLLAEHDEDLSRLGGLLRNSSAARSAGEEPLARRFVHRIPWLLVGLGGALLAADIVGAFEAQLQQTIILAFFIPGIVYLADAVGTQTETIVVRGLSVGLPMKSMARRELAVGTVIGITLAAIAGPIVWWRWGDPEVALVAALALASACSVAAVVAVALPSVFVRLGQDPAFGSGPLATVIQDLLSILIYLGIAMMVIT
jgi:magnesium transporter